MKTTILTAKNIQSICQRVGLDELMTVLIKKTNEALITFDKSQIQIPIRAGFSYQTPSPGLVEWMPLLKVHNSILLKVVGYHPQNPKEHNSPTILSNMATYDTTTGHLKSIIDGGLPTALRTGAIGAVASKILAPSSAKTLGIIGCGAQAITQFHAHQQLFPLESVYIYDTDVSAMNSLKFRLQALDHNCNVIHTSSPEEVAESVDILCTCTSVEVGNGPVFNSSDLLRHIHINAIGSDFAGKVELPKSLLEKSTVFPDFLDQALIEGECQQLHSSEIDMELHELLNSESEHERLKSSMTVFDSTGFALQDMVVSEMFLNYATELNIGSTIDMQGYKDSVKNPYAFIMAKETSELFN